MTKKLLTTMTLLLCACANGVFAQSWWRATTSTNVSADKTYVNDAILTVKTVYASTRKDAYAKTFTTDGEDFNSSIQIRVDAAPSVGTPTGTEKSGSTPLVITANKSCTIKFYYRRQANSKTFVSNDGKDMKLVDQTAPTTVLDAESFVQDGTATDYDWCIKSYKIKSGKTYTLWARGTTVSLNGFCYVEDGTNTTKNEGKSDQHAYLYNNGTIGGITDNTCTLSFTNYPLSIVGSGADSKIFEAGSDNYKFTVGGSDRAAIKVKKGCTYVITPEPGVTISSAIAYATSNSTSTSQITSGESSLDLPARGTSGVAITPTSFTLNKNKSNKYEFAIAGSAGQAIIVLDITYDQAENVDVTVSDAGYATLYYDKKLTIPAGVTAYSASVKDASTITLTKVVDVIPANTGVILKADAGKYNFAVTTDDAPSVSGNILSGTTTATTKAALGGTVYTLGQNSEGVVGLRSYTGTDIRAYSAYTTSISSSRSFYSLDFETTGIQRIENSNQGIEGYYNLSGQRVVKPTKGLYIVNGKKIVVK